jgi:hypothetical protein
MNQLGTQNRLHNFPFETLNTLFANPRSRTTALEENAHGLGSSPVAVITNEFEFLWIEKKEIFKFYN